MTRPAQDPAPGFGGDVVGAATSPGASVIDPAPTSAYGLPVDPTHMGHGSHTSHTIDHEENL
jgi:hypothetical protein